jgi:hypothetical protein
MSFAVGWEAEAEEDLQRLPPVLASAVLDELDRIAVSPTRLSKPSHFPYRPAQAYEFSREFQGRTYYLTLLFHYGQDEQTIVLDAIGCTPIPPRA